MRGRRVWSWVLGAVLLGFAGWTAVRLVGVERGFPAVQLIAFTPYVAAAVLLPLLAASVTRLWWHAAVAGVLAVALAACVLPRAVPGTDDPRPLSGRLRVLTANLLVGSADPAALVRLVREQRVDVLAVQELTAKEVTALDAAGVGALLPYRAVYPRWSAAGSGIYSRFPLERTGEHQLPRCHTQAYGTVRMPGTSGVSVESVHPCAPQDGWSSAGWAADIAAEPVATSTGTPRVLLGDFNGTLDHGGLRDLLDTGYRDAAETVGSGLVPTWPSFSVQLFGLPVPPVTLDHVFADQRIGIVSASVHPIKGSDHRAVLAELSLPA